MQRLQIINNQNKKKKEMDEEIFYTFPIQSRTMWEVTYQYVTKVFLMRKISYKFKELSWEISLYKCPVLGHQGRGRYAMAGRESLWTMKSWELELTLPWASWENIIYFASVPEAAVWKQKTRAKWFHV